MCVISVAGVPLPVPPLARLIEREEGSDTHSGIYTLCVFVGVVFLCENIDWQNTGVSSGLSWVAVTAGEDKPPQCLYSANPPSPTGVSLSSTHSAAERTASLPPALPLHHITLHRH